jgi:hypothetical protein
VERFSVELLYVLAFIGFILYNFVMQQAARRRQQEEAARSPAEPPPVEEELAEDIWGRPPAQAPLPAAAPLPALRLTSLPDAALPERRRHPVRALLQDPRDLRRAVVLTMVLGPCRSQEPPER